MLAFGRIISYSDGEAHWIFASLSLDDSHSLAARGFAMLPSSLIMRSPQDLRPTFLRVAICALASLLLAANSAGDYHRRSRSSDRGNSLRDCYRNEHHNVQSQRDCVAPGSDLRGRNILHAHEHNSSDEYINF